MNVNCVQLSDTVHLSEGQHFLRAVVCNVSGSMRSHEENPLGSASGDKAGSSKVGPDGGAESPDAQVSFTFVAWL
jgi:hypothetical protein